jgi:hypothetical protein
MWSGSAGSAVDLNPSFARWSYIYGAAGTQQVGFGVSGVGTAEKRFAVLWQGSAASGVPLHPSTGYTSSFALATDGSRQVGYVLPEGGRLRAVMWRGTAESMVDLTPPGFWTAQAQGFLGEYVVGNASASLSDSTHAVLWTRPDNGVTILGPVGSHLEATGGGQAVGWLGLGRAYVWTGPDGSGVELHPAGKLWSYALATNGRQQVGYIDNGTNVNAALWSGTADSYVDLQALLPPGFSNTHATGIDADGNIVGYGDYQSFPHAIMWAVPEPGTLGLCGLFTCVALARRSKRSD